MKREIAKKISVKGVTGGKAAWFKEVVELDGQRLSLMQIMGIASGFKPILSEHGESIAFIGDFRALNVKTGDVQRGGKCFLPKELEGPLHAQLANGASGIQFAFDIGVKFDASTPVSYTYSCISLMDMGKNDPLEMMALQLADSGVIQLAAPVGDGGAEAESETDAVPVKTKAKSR